LDKAASGGGKVEASLRIQNNWIFEKKGKTAHKKLVKSDQKS